MNLNSQTKVVQARRGNNFFRGSRICCGHSRTRTLTSWFSCEGHTVADIAYVHINTIVNTPTTARVHLFV